MVTTFHHIFFLKKSKKALNGPVIYARITVAGKRVEMSTGMRVQDSRNWIPKVGRLNESTSEAKRINTGLNLFEHQIYSTYYRMASKNENITAVALKKGLLGNFDDKRMLVPIFHEHNRRVEALVPKEYAAGTLERYKTCLSHTIAFMRWKYNSSDINIQEINHEFIADYDFYLRSVRNCSNNTTVKYLKNFKKIIRICLANGWMNKDPFCLYTARIKEIEAVYLLKDELEAIRVKNFATDRLNHVKDIFMFCCFTGLAYADVRKVTPENIVTGIDGSKWLFVNRTKSGSASHVPLLPIALEILDKYKEHKCRMIDHKLLPVLSNQKMNSYLKEIAGICAIQKELTFHTARHTFATTITLSNNVPIETVSKMLGHKTIASTEHYAKVQDKKVSQDMRPLYLKF